MPKYYAVAIGRNPGIYNTWDECKCEITKFPGAKYKKFTDKKQALDFMKEFFVESKPTPKTTFFKKNGELTKKKKVSFKDLKQHEDKTVVFTDGCCINNGKTSGKILGGYGVFFGYGDERNLAEPYYDNPTNNKTELYAIIKAMEIMIPTLTKDKKHKLYIFTDSIYSLKSFTEWADKWEKNGWKKSGGIIKNIELIKKGYNLYKKYKSQIRIVKVKAHTGDKNIVAVYNDMADKLANQGADKMNLI